MVAQAAGSKENIEQAKRSAKVIIGALYEHVDWTVSVVWDEPKNLAAAETCQR